MIRNQVSVRPREPCVGFDCPSSMIFHAINIDIEIEGDYYKLFNMYAKRFQKTQKEALAECIRQGCYELGKLAEMDEIYHEEE